MFRQKEQHEQIESLQIMVHLARGQQIIRKHPQINHVEETKNLEWCVSKVPGYIIKNG